MASEAAFQDLSQNNCKRYDNHVIERIQELLAGVSP